MAAVSNADFSTSVSMQSRARESSSFESKRLPFPLSPHLSLSHSLDAALPLPTGPCVEMLSVRQSTWAYFWHPPKTEIGGREGRTYSN